MWPCGKTAPTRLRNVSQDKTLNVLTPFCDFVAGAPAMTARWPPNVCNIRAIFWQPCFLCLLITAFSNDVVFQARIKNNGPSPVLQAIETGYIQHLLRPLVLKRAANRNP